MLQFFLCLFLLCLSFGAIGSFFIFAIDVIKWHKREERVKVFPSAGKLPDEFLKESEVKSDAPEQSSRSMDGIGGSSGNTSPADSAESKQPDTSALFDTWM